MNCCYDTLSVAAIKAWVQKAQPHERIVYTVGYWAWKSAAAREAWHQYESGKVELVQRRVCLNKLEYLMVRRAIERPVPRSMNLLPEDKKRACSPSN